MDKVTLRGHITVPGEDLAAIIESLPMHINLTRKEKGCLVFSVEQDQTNENIFHVYEEFDGQDSFDFHQNRVRSSEWGRISKNVERHYEITKG